MADSFLPLNSEAHSPVAPNPPVRHSLFKASRYGLAGVEQDERRSANRFCRSTRYRRDRGGFCDHADVSVALSYLLYQAFVPSARLPYPVKTILLADGVFAVTTVVMLGRAGAYRRGKSLLSVRVTEQVLRACAQALAIVLVASLFDGLSLPRGLWMAALITVPLSLSAQKHLMSFAVRALHGRGRGNERVLIYGAGGTGRRVFSVLSRSPKLGLQAVSFVDDDPAKAGDSIYEMAYERRSSLPVEPGPLTEEMIVSHGVGLVILAMPSLNRERFDQIMAETGKAKVRVSFVPGDVLASGPQIDYQDIDGVLLASFGRRDGRLGYEIIKRICDLVFSLALIILGAPLFLALAVAIKVDSPGPVFCRQSRVGRRGKLFTMYKFRTMHIGSALYDYSPQAADDRRITRLGRFLRRTSLDEIPQLLNDPSRRDDAGGTAAGKCLLSWSDIPRSTKNGWK